MRKNFVFLLVVAFCMACVSATAATVAVKKASSVKAQETSGLESMMGSSLVPNVVGLVTNVAALNKQAKEFDKECIPTESELRWVEKMVKEYAKIGGTNSYDGKICGDSEKNAWINEVRNTSYAKMQPGCSAVALDEANYIWNGYPKPQNAEYCSDQAELSGCSSSKKKKTTNMWDIFSMVSAEFAEEDYLADEISTYNKLMEKAEKCAPSRIKARKKEAYAGFIIDAVSNAGKKTNTGTILEAVSGLTQGGTASGMQTLLPVVTQFLDR